MFGDSKKKTCLGKRAYRSMLGASMVARIAAAFMLLAFVGRAHAADYELQVNDVTVTEAAGSTAVFTISIVPTVAGSPVTVDYETEDGSATTADGDYISQSGTSTFPNGSNSGQIHVPITDDGTAELMESFYLSLSGATKPGGDSVAITDNQGQCTITDDEAPVDVSVEDITVAEDVGNATFTVSLSSNDHSGVTVVYATVDGSALQPGDYTQTTGTLTIAAGNDTGTIDVPINDDDKAELSESFYLNLTAAGDNANITDSQAQGTITDNEVVFVAVGNVAVNEGVGTATFTVALSSANHSGVTVVHSTADGSAEDETGDNDYTSISGATLSIAAGSNTGTVDVPITDDGKAELTEAFYLNLTDAGDNATITDNQAQCTVTDNDDVDVSVEDITVAEDVGNATFTVSLSANDHSGVTVAYTTADGSATTADNDYTAVSGTTLIPAGITTHTVDVPIIPGGKAELSESFYLNLTDAGDNANITDSQAQCTITDNDDVNVTVADITVAEDVGTATFTVSLSSANHSGVTVVHSTADDSAEDETGGNDYTAISGVTLAIAAGSNTGTVDVPINDDATVELSEVFDLNLTDASDNATFSVPGDDDNAKCTITDNDTAVFSINDQTVDEASGPMTFTVTLSNPIDIAVDVNVYYTDVTASGVTDYDNTTDTVTITPPAMSADVDVAIVNDAISEDNETFISGVSLVTGIGNRIFDDSDTGTGTIMDNDYTLTMLVDPSGSGCTIEFTPTGADCGPACESLDGDVTLTPVPEDGFAFSHWTGALSGVSYPQTVTMDANKSVTAHFEHTEDCSPKVNQKTDGSAWASLGFYDFTFNTAADGEEITLTHQGDGSISFDAVGFFQGGVLVPPAVDDAAATYSPSAGWSAVTCGDCFGGTHHETNAAGDKLTIDLDGLGLAPGTYEVKVRWKAKSDRDETAEYCVVGYGSGSGGHPITATAGANGVMTYSVSGGSSGTVPEGGTTRFWVSTGDDVTFTFEPDDGTPQYRIEYVSVDGDNVTGLGYEGSTDPETYTFPSVASAHDITVSFNRGGEPTTTCVYVDQQQEGTFWYPLGTYDFPSGVSAYVTLSHEGDGSVSLDALRWEPAGGGADIIIDDMDAEAVYDESGTTDWAVQDCTDCYDGYHHYSDAQGDLVTVRPDIPEAGVYSVYARWHAGPYRDTTAAFCVHGHRGHVILAEAGPNGVMVTDSGVTVESGTTKAFTMISGSGVTFTAIADNGYEIDQFLADGISVKTAGSGVTTDAFAFTNIQHSHTILALFEDHGFDCGSATPISCGSGVSGLISPEGDQDYFEVDLAGSGRYTFFSEGDTDTLGTLLDAYCNPLTADDDGGVAPNFSIVENLDAGVYYISVEGATSGTTGEYSLNMVCEHIIRASAGNGGRIDPAGNVIVGQNSGATFTITPNSGVTIVDVIVDGNSVGGVSTYAFHNVTENHTIEAVFSFEPTSCTEISDVPLDALTSGVGAIVMFVLDDSGSMDWEFMTEQGDGLFMNRNYVFDNPGDNLYSNNTILDGEDRGRWRSQWQGYNRIYYNPSTVYETWPTLPDADPDTPRSHPYHASSTFDLDETYYTVTQGYVVNNDGVYDGSFVNDDGTEGEFTCTKDGWERSSGNNWYGNDTTRSAFSSQSGATASWTPNLPADGAYEIYVWYTTAGTRDADVPYQVVYDGGAEYGLMSDLDTPDQRSDGGSWVKLYKSDGSDTWLFSAAETAAGRSGVTLTRWNDSDTVPAGDGAGGNELPTPSGDDWNNGYHGDTTCADAVAFVPVGSGTIDIHRSHYYTLYDLNGDEQVDSGETVYLVNLNGDTSSIEYYVVDASDDHVAAGDLMPVAADDVPAGARPSNADGSFRTYEQERQNFANWYSFYRRRELTAIAAISRTIYDLEGVYVGFKSINGKIEQKALPINLDGEDRRSDLLTTLYEYVGSAYGTPLRRGFEDAGQYLDQTDGSDGGISSDSPWAAQGSGGECQQAFAIVMTDGYYNGSNPDVDNADGDNGAPYADGYWETLADVAMHYYENDLVSTLTDDVPTNEFDDADHQHMVTYTVSFGVTGTLDPDDYDLSSGSTNYPTWPNPQSSSQNRIDDMWHAAVNGRGQYLSAGDPDELVESLLTIMQNIAARTGSAASVSINGDQLFGVLGDEVRIFQARYSSGTMTGDVLSFALDQATGSVLNTPVWSAADQLDTRVENQGHNDRLVITKSLASGGGGIPFTYSSISTSGTTLQVEALTPDWSASAAASPENLVNYLRGEQTHEFKNAGPFRDRTSRLGDIVNSSPLYYAGMLYVGGNDGMLHALDAESGEEMFAYVPGLVYDHLKDYADPDYSHLFYVDQTPYAAENVDISGTDKTVLFGGFGKGGKGYYALDITGFSGSTSFASMTESTLAGRVLWEYPDADTTLDEIDDLGYSFSRAYLYGSNDKTNAPQILIFGNGYNSENSSAVLFILDPADGTLLKRIDTGVTNCNGLSSPALFDDDFDGDVDYIYAGDLRGNLWKFDLTSSDYNDWGVAFGSDNDVDGSINAADGDSPQPLFQAQGPGGTAQPITVEPDFLFHCDPDRQGMQVVFGTGKYLGEDDISDASTQAVYGIWDYGDDSQDDEYLGTFQSGFSPELSNQPASVTLLQQTATDYTQDIEVDSDGDGTLDSTEEMTIRVLSDNIPDWSVTTTPDGGTSCGDFPGSEVPCDPECTGCAADPLVHAGWYVNLPQTGERVIGNPLVRLGVLNYVTFTPEDSPCGGEGFSFPVFADPCTGGNLGEPYIDINQDGVIDEQDLINIGTDANPIWVAPSSKKFSGRLQPPAIVRMPGSHGSSLDKYFFSSSLGTIEEETTIGAKMGIIYWKDMLR